MLALLRIEPIATNEIGVGIEAGKKRIGQRRLPDAGLNFDPVGNDFLTFDGNFLTGGRLVNDALVIAQSAAWRIDALAINALMNQNDIPRQGKLGSALDGAQRQLCGPGLGIIAVRADGKFAGGSGHRRQR